MEQILLQRGFKFVGGCNCHGFPSKWYEHVNHPGLRIEIGNNNFWVKKKNGVVTWNTIDQGNQNRFNEILERYFTVK